MAEGELNEEQSKALDQVKAVYEDGKAEINGREYVFNKMTHKKRRKVFAFFTRIQHDLQRGDFWWMESPEFEGVEQIINDTVTFGGDALSRLDTHWDHYPQDYMLFISTALGVISYPFMTAAHTA